MTPGEVDAFVVFRVRGAMLDHLRSLDPVSRTRRSQSRRVSHTISEFTKRHGRPPEEHEIATALGMSAEAFRALLESIALANMARLEGKTLEYVEPTCGRETPEEATTGRDLQARVASKITELSPRLQHVLALYYQEECSLREIGEILGVTESRACQLHSEAMHRLRAMLEGVPEDRKRRAQTASRRNPSRTVG
jgi:RNA polymerase sigma factor for flagellar operon FliA